MHSFSDASKERLAACDQRLQAVFEEVIHHMGCTILETEPEQRLREGPRKAIDVAPHPASPSNEMLLAIYFAGFVIATGVQMGIRLRWAGDLTAPSMYNENIKLNDLRLNGLFHFELIE